MMYFTILWKEDKTILILFQVFLAAAAAIFGQVKGDQHPYGPYEVGIKNIPENWNPSLAGQPLLFGRMLWLLDGGGSLLYLTHSDVIMSFL